VSCVSLFRLQEQTKAMQDIMQGAKINRASFCAAMMKQVVYKIREMKFVIAKTPHVSGVGNM